jgi:hypothetical protein
MGTLINILPGSMKEKHKKVEDLPKSAADDIAVTNL